MQLINPSTEPVDFDDVITNGPFPIRFPKKGDQSNPDFGQDKEWCEVKVEGEWRRIRFHDYAEVYKVPGLYETIFYRTLRCNSPNRITSILNEVLIELNIDVSKLRVLDVGAGNGMSGEALQAMGARKVVGIDLLPEAKMAALRDRPWVYDDYRVADLTKLSPEDEKFFGDYHFNTLCTVAALGFGDIPPLAFFHAFNLISDQGLLAFNIKDEFLKRNSNSAFAKLIDRMIQKEILEIEAYKRYQHRLSITGHPLYYVGIVARKNANLNEEILAGL